MIVPNVDEEVKIFFKNGTTVEGIVVSWNASELILRSVGATGHLIIYHPEENIMMVRVLEKESTEAPPLPPRRAPVPPAPPTPDIPSTLPGRPTRDEMRERAFRAAERAQREKENDKVNLASNLQRPPQPVQGEARRYEFPNFTKHRTINRSPKKNVRGA